MYIWMSSKPRKKVHLTGVNTKTLCKVENTGPGTDKRLDTTSETLPEGRTLCGVCEQLTATQRRAEKPKRPSKTSIANAQFYTSWQWSKLRFEILKKYGPRCMLCGETEGKIVVDHIKPRSKYPELELDPDNMQVLCDTCNRGKGNKDETDFRPLRLPYEMH